MEVRMCATWKFELKKHFCEKRGQLLKKMSEYQNIKIVLHGEVELASLLTGSKKSWMYLLLFFIFSLRYFVDHDRGFYHSADQKFFFLIENQNF